LKLSRCGKRIPGFAVVLICCIGGCVGPHRRDRGPALPPLPMQSAVDLVNENAAKITGSLRATGAVDGEFATDRGRRVSYHLDGTLFYLAPQYLRFDLKKMGNRQFLFGSNEQMYWVYDGDKETYHCGFHGGSQGSDEDMPIRPDRIRDALGLTPLHLTESEQPIQRLTADSQQITFRSQTAETDGVAVREYWLDRRAPRLIRRVIYRDAKGKVLMESRLSEHEALAEGGPYVPQEMEALWPQDHARMSFHVSKWNTVPDVSATSPQFKTPTECARGSYYDGAD